MRAVVWHGKRDVRVEDVFDPVIQTGERNHPHDDDLSGSDLRLYEVLGAFVAERHPRPRLIGIVEEVGAEVTGPQPVDRVVIPFEISCGTCCMCSTACRASARRPGPRRREAARPCSATPRLLRLRCPEASPGSCGARRRGTGPSRARSGQPRRHVRLPVRRAAHVLAGQSVRGDPPRHGAHGLGPMGGHVPAASRCTARRRPSRWSRCRATRPRARPRRARSTYAADGRRPLRRRPPTAGRTQS